MKSAAFHVVIPSRYASSRFPGKPLALICGEPMILHVCQCVAAAGATSVIVATDDQRIQSCVEQAGFQVQMTRSDHQSGTDRIAEVVAQLAWPDQDIVVNVQGDEPLIAAEHIQALVAVLAKQQKAQVATLSTVIDQTHELFDTNAVKVVTDRHGYALYFSRASIPWDRDNFPEKSQLPNQLHQRHIGMYAYRAGFLRDYQAWELCELEAVEKLEQLRILWQGEAIIVESVSPAPAAGVDTPEDLQRVEAILRETKDYALRT